jgi:mutator protein MutT
LTLKSDLTNARPDAGRETAVLMASQPDDNNAFRFPVSVKGVVIRAGRVVLLENERDEWELPGGKLEPSEAPHRCAEREIREELGLEVQASQLLDAWVYAITPEVRVFIITYGCVETAEREAILSREHSQLRWVRLAEVDSLRMPDGYKQSVRAWARRIRGGGES